jgi:hypothetical protein
MLSLNGDEVDARVFAVDPEKKLGRTIGWHVLIEHLLDRGDRRGDPARVADAEGRAQENQLQRGAEEAGGLDCRRIGDPQSEMSQTPLGVALATIRLMAQA